jgi:hypothetical protein
MKNPTCENKTEHGGCSAASFMQCNYTNETIFGQEEDCGLFSCSNASIKDEVDVFCNISTELCKETKRLEKCPKITKKPKATQMKVI